MSISETEFVQGCELLSRAWQASPPDNNWRTCVLMKESTARWLRIERMIALDQSAPSECELDIEEMDEESLQPVPQLARSVSVQYDIVYSQTYQVPVLYLHAQDTLHSLDELYSMLVRTSSEVELRKVGVLGALSLVDHPVHGNPVYMMHPCRTQEAMREILGEDKVQPICYLLLCFGLLGGHVGLSVSPGLIESLQQA